MNAEKLKFNLDILKDKIARKPSSYTPEHSLTFSETFTHYTNTRTINLLLSFSELLSERGWPYPSFITRETERDVRGKMFGFMLILAIIKQEGLFNFLKVLLGKPKKNIEGFDVEGFYKLFDNTMLTSFDFFKKKIFKSWKKNRILNTKESVIDQIEICYNKKLWISCISTSFPLLDYILRNYMRTRRFEKDINHLLAIFKSACIRSAHLKPGFGGREVYEEGFPRPNINEDLRLIGVGLSSFIDIASIYYGYFRKDFMAPDSDYPLNRHGVIHSASSDFNSKENAVKLLTFIDLTLDLEETFRILLKED